MRWNIRQIEVFITVLQEGSFTGAGERLGMVQPAVSIAIRKLEDSTGVKLLDRSGRKVRATRDGELFFKQAQLICTELGNLERQMRELRSLVGGQILIGAPPIVTGFLLPPIIGAFLGQHPGIEISAVTGPSEGIVQRVRDRELDIGVIAGDHDTSGLETILIERHPIVACGAKDSLIASLPEIGWDRLLDEPLVTFPKGYNQRSIVDRMAAELAKQLNIAIESESARFVTAMVAAGRGVSVGLGAMVREFPNIVLVPIVEMPTLPIRVCRRKGSTFGIAANALFDSIVIAATPASD
jgi:DNA-binding transcriptional LysR family regulator